MKNFFYSLFGVKPVMCYTSANDTMRAYNYARNIYTKGL